MSETKKTYEQYCTHLRKNIIMEETITSEGEVIVICTNNECVERDENCKNKLRQK